MKILPFLFLLAAGAAGVPTLIAAFNGEPTNGLLAALSSGCLLLALLSFPYSPRSESKTEASSN
jgi:hypothetical protein